MNYNLNDKSSLVNFFNEIFQDEELAKIAPNIMKFFIITRNYGLIDYQNNINKLKNNVDINELAIKVIQDGFMKNNIKYSNQSLLSLLINNYHQNGFYFHSFPDCYKESIKENGILANNRNNDDDKYYEIMKKYDFSSYFTNSDNRVCVTENLSIFGTHEYSLYTPEWLEYFIGLGIGDIHEPFGRGNLEEMINITKQSLLNIKKDMMKNSSYDENDYQFLERYITNIVYNRFKDGNDKISVAFIEKNKSTDYFGKHITNEDINDFRDYIIARKLNDKEIFNFIIDGMSNGEKDSEKSIPSNLINIVSYKIKNDTKEDDKTK